MSERKTLFERMCAIAKSNALEPQRLSLEANVNRYLANAAQDAGFAHAHSDIPGTVGELAPGWDYVDITPHGSAVPVISLTTYSPGAL